MEIYLLRHGIAEDTRPGGSDAGRALTSEGKEKLRRVLKRARVEVSLILSSPYKRAVETAAIAAEVLGYPGKIVQIESLVPHGSTYAVWDELRAHKEDSAVLLASHEPLMSMMAAFLLDCPALHVDMKKAALVRIDCDKLGPKPGGVLKWMLTPAVSE